MPIYAWIAAGLGTVVLAVVVRIMTARSEPPAEAAEAIALDGKARRLEGVRYMEYRVGLTVAASPERLWQLLTDAASFPKWNSTVVSIDGTIAQDQKIALVAKVAPGRTFTLLVSAFQPHSRMVWQDGNRIFKGVRTFKLSPRADGATDVTMAEVLTGAMLAQIAPQLPDFRPPFEAFVADLKKAAE